MTLRSFAPKSTALFAGGGSEPYARLLSSGRDGSFTLRRLSGAHGEAEPRELWHASDLRGPATRADLSALDEVRGPLLDVGCGPGRMVRAAAGMAMPALGIDISHDAVSLATSDGTRVLLRSIFDRLPLEGGWRTILLMDRNIGIGGDPDALVGRCRALLADGGVIVIEVDDDPDLDERALFTVVDDLGNESAPFPWARLGWSAAIDVVLEAGFDSATHSVVDGRHFVRAVRRRRANTVPTRIDARTSAPAMAHMVASAAL